MHRFYYMFQNYLTNNPLSYEMGLGDPYLEVVNLSFTFTWDDGETEDRAKVPTSPFFERLLINNSELRDISTRIICMVIPTRLKIIRQIERSKIRMSQDY